MRNFLKYVAGATGLVVCFLVGFYGMSFFGLSSQLLDAEDFADKEIAELTPPVYKEPLNLDKINRSIVKIKNATESGQCLISDYRACGTGVVIYSGEGKSLILTNNHIGERNLNCNSSLVYLFNEVSPIVGTLKSLTNGRSDLSIIEINRELPVMEIANNGDLHTLDNVAIVGNPYCEDWMYHEGKYIRERFGVLDAVASMFSAISYPGNSGSPMINEDGKIVSLLFAGNRDIASVSFGVPLYEIHQYLEEVGFPDVQKNWEDKEENDLEDFINIIIKNIFKGESDFYFPEFIK